MWKPARRKQVTDGLADSVWPAWDASGKYLWFLASTDFGLKSQWLDMTSYDHDENFGLYLAVLKKGEPSPLLPESDEDKGVGSAASRRPRRPRRPAPPMALRPTQPAPAPRSAHSGNVQIDFDGLQQRIIAVAGVPERQYSQLRAGVAGTVYYLEAPAAARRGDAAARRPRQHAAALSAERSPRRAVRGRRRRLRRQRRWPQAGVSHGAGGGPAAAARRAAEPPPPLRRSSSSMPIDSRPTAGQGGSTSSLRMYLEPKEEFKQIFYEGWRNQRDYLYVPNMHGADWPQDEGDVRPVAAVRQSIAPT